MRLKLNIVKTQIEKTTFRDTMMFYNELKDEIDNMKKNKILDVRFIDLNFISKKTYNNIRKLVRRFLGYAEDLLLVSKINLYRHYIAIKVVMRKHFRV